MSGVDKIGGGREEQSIAFDIKCGKSEDLVL